jgi:hypothetical protein
MRTGHQRIKTPAVGASMMSGTGYPAAADTREES